METTENISELRRLLSIYEKDPKGLSSDWVNFFDDLDEGAILFLQNDSFTESDHFTSDVSDLKTSALDAIRARLLIRSYRVLGHLEANLDPLGIAEKKTYQELDPLFYGFKEEDLQRLL